MKAKRVLVGVLSLALIAGVSVSCKKRNANKRVVGSWSASSYTETSDVTNDDANLWDHDDDFLTDDVAGIYRTLITGSESLSGSSQTTTTINQAGETVVQTFNDLYTRSLSIDLNEDGTMLWTQTDQINSQTISTSPANVCDVNFGTAGIDCDGTYTYVTDNTESTTLSGIWYWGNDTDDRSSIVFEVNGSVMVFGATLDKETLELTKTNTMNTTEPSSDGGGTDTYSSTTVTTISLTK